MIAVGRSAVSRRERGRRRCGGHCPVRRGGHAYAAGGAWPSRCAGIPRADWRQAGRVAAPLLLAVLAAAAAAAEVRTAVTLEARLTGLSHPRAEPLLGGGGSAKLDLVATGSRDVRGQLSLVADLHPAPFSEGSDAHTHPVAGSEMTGAHAHHQHQSVASVAVERAFVRARLPGFRLTAGKTRLAWGRGRFFNAGDILFGEAPAFAAGASEFLTAADWLVAVYVPLDRLSFLELVALPPPDPRAIGDTDAGARAVVRLGDLTVEGGYLYAAAADPGDAGREHRGYLSLKGAVTGVDWHLSGGSALPAASPGAALRQAAADRLYVTTGGFGFLDLGPEAGLVSLRLEAGLRPWRGWEERTGGLPPALGHYGIYLFPELGYSPAENWNLSLSGVLSPVDRSGVAAAGASWNILQGLTFSLYTAVMFGDADDTFAWDLPGGLAATLFARYVFGSS